MNNDCTANVSLHHLHISLQKVGRLYFLNLGVKGLSTVTHGGLYQSRVNSSLLSVERLGHKVHSCGIGSYEEFSHKRKLRSP